MSEQKNEIVVGAVGTMKSAYSTHFTKNFNVDGSPSGTDLEAIFNNPQDNIENIVAYSKYCYRKHGIIMRVVNIIRDFGASGHRLNYPTKGKKVQEVIAAFNEQIDLEQLIRDVIFELALTGNVALYDRDGFRIDIYPINQIKVVPLIKNNKQVIAYKVEQQTISLDSYGKEIDAEIEKAYPQEILEAMKHGEEYAVLDENNAYFAKVNASQYEPYGVSVILPAFEDLSHKSLLKEAEKSTANDIIDKILQIKVGDADNKPTKQLLQDYDQLFAGKSGSLRVTTPYYVLMDWIEPKTDIFGADKFIEIDTDILNTLGVSLTLIRGEGGGNYAEGMLNFTGLTRTIEGIRRHIPCIIHDLYRNELKRKGLNPDHAPTLSFEDVVIDPEAKTSLLMELFQNAGLPYKVLYEGCGMDFDSLKLIREDENEQEMDETFKIHSMPFQGQQETEGNEDSENPEKADEGGAPKKKVSERKSDKTSSNNKQPRTGLKGTNRSK